MNLLRLVICIIITIFGYVSYGMNFSFHQLSYTKPVFFSRSNSAKTPILSVQAELYPEGKLITEWVNKSNLQGSWKTSPPTLVKNFCGRKAFYLDTSRDHDGFSLNSSLLNKNSLYTIEMVLYGNLLGFISSFCPWVFYDIGPFIKEDKILSDWTHVVLNFDGANYQVFINGNIAYEVQKPFRIAAQEYNEKLPDVIHFSGYLASMTIWDNLWDLDKIKSAAQQHRKSYYLYSLESADLDKGKLNSLIAYGSNLMPQITGCGTCGLELIGDRTAFKVQKLNSSYLNHLLERSEWLLSIEYFDKNNWKQVVIKRESGTEQVFVNAELSDRSFKDFITLQHNEIKLGINKIHNIRVYRDPDLPIKHLYAEFQNKMDLNVVGDEIVVETEPYKINSKSPFIAVKDVNPYVKYKFFQGFEESPWSDEPFCLFREYNGHINIYVQMRDIYGKIGSKKAVAVQIPKYVLMSDHEVMDWYPTDSSNHIAYWTNMDVPTNKEETDLKVTKGFQGWMLGSKNTRFNAENWKGPFLYKDLEGDFTIQVHVADISGRLSGKRTLNEVGIKIQAENDVQHYITHTICTDGDMGNVGRSVAGTHAIEILNGKGIYYEPFLQVQKVGNKFYLRTSKNGTIWNDLPNSPFMRSDLYNKKLKVGIYQIANEDTYGYGIFSDVNLFKFEEALSKTSGD